MARANQASVRRYRSGYHRTGPFRPQQTSDRSRQGSWRHRRARGTVTCSTRRWVGSTYSTTQTLLQLLEPVLDDNHADRRRVRITGCAGFEHEESLAVSRHVEMARGVWLGILGVEQLHRTADADRRFGCTDRHGGECIRGVEIEQLVAAPRPDGACAARRRDLPAAV